MEPRLSSTNQAQRPVSTLRRTAQTASSLTKHPIKHRALDEPQHGMVAWPYKVIQPAPGGRARIFDLSADPGERRDLAGTLDPAERRRLVGALRHWHEQVRQPFDDALRH